MQDTDFIIRDPLLDTQARVLGYELSWQATSNRGRPPSEEEVRHLLRRLAEHRGEDGDTPLLGDQLLFIEVTAGMVTSEAIASVPPRGTVLVLRGQGQTEGLIEPLLSLRTKGYGLALRDVTLDGIAKRLLPGISFLELRADAPGFSANLTANLKQQRSLQSPGLRLVARGLGGWDAFEACAGAGLLSFAGSLHLAAPSRGRSKGLNPTQALILELMDMVRKNADVRQLEGVLKRDAALSYKLLRYINSAGFGLGCEIQSLRHAVTLLGYAPLYRWLALLLATATTAGYAPVLMQAAVIRGRFAELLGSGFLPRNEAENLFVAGMFSLLDRMLGVPMEQVLEKVQLSEAVSQALLAREGIYGPFLALAEACELNNPDVDAMATDLCIGRAEVNRAHLSALTWAQSLRL